MEAKKVAASKKGWKKGKKGSKEYWEIIQQEKFATLRGMFFEQNMDILSVLSRKTL
jgi:hypothetical protein